MENEKYISIDNLAGYYEIEVSFFQSLGEMGLVSIRTVENKPCVERDCLSDLERMIRLHYDLEINMAGLDAISHLLVKVRELQSEVNRLKNRLGE